MESTNHKSLGYLATQPAHVQVRHTMDNLKTFGDLRAWPVGARKELLCGSQVDVINGNDDIIGTAPKLLLMVVSSVFRQHFEDNTDSKKVKVLDPLVKDRFIGVLLAWAKAMVAKPTAKGGVDIPVLNTELIDLYYAALKLGMKQYVSHFIYAYKVDLQDRTPPPSECVLLEQLAPGLGHRFIYDAATRLVELRLNRQLTSDMVASLNRFLQVSPRMRAAVKTADWRASQGVRPSK